MLQNTIGWEQAVWEFSFVIRTLLSGPGQVIHSNRFGIMNTIFGTIALCTFMGHATKLRKLLVSYVRIHCQKLMYRYVSGACEPILDQCEGLLGLHQSNSFDHSVMLFQEVLLSALFLFTVCT